MQDRLSQDEDKKYKTIYGGLSWPGEKAPGFVVVVGQLKEAPGKMVLLDEVEAGDVRETVRAAGGLDFFYSPDAWIGNPTDASNAFIREMNKENSTCEEENWGKRNFRMSRSRLLDMQNPFAYLFPKLKNLMDPERKRLEIKDGKLRRYLLAPQTGDLEKIDLGTYPSIEALAFAALALDERRQTRPRQECADNDYDRLRHYRGR